MKILVVEDNADITYLLNYILEGEGHEVITSSDGAVISDILSIDPGIVLMDEILTGPRGSELCKIIKSNEATRHIRVILLSATTHLEKTAYDCGADAFIEKPFDIENLIQVIKGNSTKI